MRTLPIPLYRLFSRPPALLVGARSSSTRTPFTTRTIFRQAANFLQQRSHKVSTSTRTIVDLEGSEDLEGLKENFSSKQRKQGQTKATSMFDISMETKCSVPANAVHCVASLGVRSAHRHRGCKALKVKRKRYRWSNKTGKDCPLTWADGVISS